MRCEHPRKRIETRKTLTMSGRWFGSRREKAEGTLSPCFDAVLYSVLPFGLERRRREIEVVVILGQGKKWKK